MLIMFYPSFRLLFTLIFLAQTNLIFAEDVISFNFDIRPILSDRCFLCHGPDAENREADLRLDTAEGAYRALEFGTGSHAIKPGDPQQSEVYVRITSKDEFEVMPPPDSKLSLTKSEIELIRKWIEQGAEYQGHWAFESIGETEVPTSTSQWGNNEIDRFVARLHAAKKLKPNPPASREKLLRRVTFDLTGLPPTLGELNEFLNDHAENAFEKAVDRLLSSDRYGERMASEWLDVARYSDTYGYQVDRDRYVWPWRDWVIRSFNRNMPYDQFITEQLAGDLLPDATDDQILATTFNRLHPQKVEGGSTPEEFRIEYIADRTQTFGTAFLGLTMECCRCHDHKYDPVTQKEYFQFSAFFDNIDEAGLYSYFTSSVPTPTLMLMDQATKDKVKAAQEKVLSEEQKLEEVAKAQEKAFQQWLTDFDVSSLTPQGEIAVLEFEEVGGRNSKVDGINGSAVKLTGDDAVGTKVGNFKRSQPFSVSLWMNTPDKKERAVIYHRSRAWTDAASRGYELLIEEGKLSAALIHFDPGNALRVKTIDELPVQKWHHIAITYDGSSRASGLKIFVNGERAETEIVRDKLTKNITGGGGDNIAIGERFRDRGFTNGLVDQFRVFDRQLTAAEIEYLFAVPNGAHQPPDQLYLRDYYFSTMNAAYQAQLIQLQKAREEHNALVDKVPEIMVMRELNDRKPSFVLTRGEYDKRSEPVQPEVAEIFPSLSQDLPRNRLALADWLTSPDHPLTARVAVNRYWQMIFGAGLVRTPEDFGSQGQLPTHPELLDWLAKDFMDHGWDVKRLLKQMVMSATYLQSSQATPESIKNDPANLWMARASNHRLPAEMLRDNALAVSGLLVNKIGGAPAKPYEVEVSFKPTERAKGEGLYRRSLYTYWKRTGPAPVMMTLDASKRDVCRVNRERTSSPLAAFVMLNGPQFVEASRVFAQRLMLEQQDAKQESMPSQVLTEMFQTLTSRVPDAEELQVLEDLYRAQLAEFETHPDRATAYLKVGDHPVEPSLNTNQLAAMSSVANILLNFDECVIKR